MRILITGASGMLGATLANLYQKTMDVYATGSSDFPDNPATNYLKFDLQNEAYDALLKWARPDVVLHCAAITNVNLCEQQPAKALAVNGESVKKFLTSGHGSRIIYISSDAVFPDGRSMKTEQDPVGPANVYGGSKVLGERHITEAGGTHCAIRTTLVGRNINKGRQSFAEWLIKSLQKQESISLFQDAIFTPISIWHFADEIQWVMRNNLNGIIHLTGREPVSKFEFGLKLCEKVGLDARLIKKSSIDDFAGREGRSKDQTLDSSLYQAISHRKLPSTSDTIELLAEKFRDFNDTQN